MGDRRVVAAAAAAKLAHGAPGHPQQEQVEDDQEAEFQGYGDGLEHGAYSSSNCIAKPPSAISSPGLRTSGPSTRRPLIVEPFVDSRSVNTHEPPRGRISACWRETPVSLSTMSH